MYKIVKKGNKNKISRTYVYAVILLIRYAVTRLNKGLNLFIN